ncbi:HTH-type transcriptional activator RhaS [Vibrio mangrovi]|nr:HTH-type transcriptional activator RhaS [Vibrio mangrovi]
MTEMTGKLAEKLMCLIDRDGLYPTSMKSLSFFKVSAPTHCDSNIYKPSFIVTLQGLKSLYLYGTQQTFSPGESLITSIDIPIQSYIVEASIQQPYLCAIFELNMSMVAQLMSELDSGSQRHCSESKGVMIVPVSDTLIDVMKRMVDLLDNPNDIPVLYPMLEREMIYRLLMGEHGEMLRQLCTFDSSSNKVMRAIQYLNENYKKTVRVDSLASRVNMSVSSLHQHFKAVTLLTPLQYQKQLRLYEARKMIMQGMEISSAAFQVGYESASHFSRDYNRTFGTSPSRDREAH